MGLILQIETATACCSLALAKDGDLLAVKQVNERNIHAGVINLFIEELVNSCALIYGDIDAVAVSCGPGSYTGLRIGVSTAKGLCFALDKPLIAVETLEAMAYAIMTPENARPEKNTLLCPMIDARRMEVFTAVFDSAAKEVWPTSARIIDKNSFNELLVDNKILFFGDGAEKCALILNDHPNAVFLPGFVNSAAHLTKMADELLKKQNFADVAYFEPYYLKDFIAGK